MNREKTTKRPCIECGKSSEDWVYLKEEKIYVCSKCYELKYKFPYEDKFWSK